MERSFISWAQLQSSKKVASQANIQIGIGDDAALLRADDRSLVVTCDSLCDGTHFLLNQCGAKAVGRKLAGVNLSDIAAMGAEATALFLSFCLPKDNAIETAQELYKGAQLLADQFDVAIAGGDTNVWSGPLVVHATAVGKVAADKAWRRSGAKVGDLVAVSGTLGGSLSGKHLDFVPRLILAKQLRTCVDVTAACDISDGLGNDLMNICTASKCGAQLNIDAIPVSIAALEMSARSNKSPLEHAMGDGEDFELLFTFAAKQKAQLPTELDGVPLTIIGEVISRTGLWQRSSTGKISQLKATGYQHQSDF